MCLFQFNGNKKMLLIEEENEYWSNVSWSVVHLYWEKSFGGSSSAFILPANVQQSMRAHTHTQSHISSFRWHVSMQTKKHRYRNTA